MQSIHTKLPSVNKENQKVNFLNFEWLMSLRIDILTEINTSVRRPTAAATSEAIPWMVGAYLQAFLRGRSEEQ